MWLGLRETRAYGIERSKFTPDGQDVLVEDTNGTSVKYQNGPGIDNPLSMKLAGSSTWSYSLTDHLGTAGVTDSFGNGSWGFTGREYDSYTKLYHYRARVYDPKLGRFTSEDPIGFEGGDVNLFGYVEQNPVNLRDPYGLFAENPYDLIPESGWIAIAHAGNFAAGFGDAVTLGGTRYVRKAMDIDSVIDPCSNSYFAGDIAGTIVPMFMGGAGVAKGALAMGGRSGSLATRLGRGTRRFFYDNRTWGSVRKQYWGTYGPATPNSIHHWMFPQRATSIPQGIRNAGFNQMVIPSGLNSWMGYSKTGRVVESVIRGAVPGLLLGGAITGAAWGEERNDWQRKCGCE